MKEYLRSKEDVLEEVKATEKGLTSAEAAEREARDGKNKLAEGKKTSFIVKFLSQFADPMIIMLLVAAAVSAGITIYNNVHSGAHESFTDVFVILFVVILNSVLGVIQESKAEQAIAALKEMTAATSKVLRDGKIEHVKSEDLVVGDVVLLEAGDSVPADGRILESASMKIEEAALTGESVPVNKHADKIDLGTATDIPLGDRKNMVYMGSTVVYGRGSAVITGTGMKTEMGKIAAVLAKAEKEQTPLQIKLGQLSKILTYLIIGICVVIFGVELIQAWMHKTLTTEPVGVVIDSFMVAVSLAVAAIPEGLAAVVTIVLSIGVTKMSKRNAVIRKMTAVETLGCTQIICSDKTGTLTQNKMTVVDEYTADKALLSVGMALCSDAELEDGNAIGEPTECALVNYAYKNEFDKNELKKKAPRIGEAPFDSGRKMMSTVHNEEGKIIQYTKGATDVIIGRCDRILTAEGVRPITEEDVQALFAENKRMADEALRVLACAYKDYDVAPTDFSAESLEKDLIFVGIVGMIDPIRPEVKDAVDRCHAAGIRVVMITGDHKDTAVAIAKSLGILEEGGRAVTGAEIEEMDDETFAANIEKFNVYARVQPEHKVRIVKAWKARGMVTAMTGDGVNDAPSIKSADIGIGMGITGTDVTKNVADMILADDNFATIVNAVDEGRRIYSNICKAIQFLLGSNLSEVLGVFIASIMGFTILKPTHLLWINLITDSLPALSLAMEDNEADAMMKPPRDKKEGIFSNGIGVDIAYQGILIGLLTLFAYFLGHYMEYHTWAITDSADGMTMAFMTLSMTEIFHSLNMRSQRGSIFKLKKQNFFLWGSFVIALALTTVVIYVPFLARLFDFQTISAAEYFTAMGLSASIIPLVEIIKLIERSVKKKKSK